MMMTPKKPGETVSHYRLLDQLGAGGMGVVFKAQDLKLDRFVALKFLPDDLELDAEQRQRFIQEAKITSALDHPNICTIYEIDETVNSQMFIAMACYEGENLREKLERGPLSTEEAIGITSQICQGLATAHDRGIIHRDIKPDNVIITNDDIVKIVDFGISKLTGSTRLTKPGTVIGTPYYMSPEQIRGKNVDHRTDLWSVGVLFYNMLTCELPFSGDSDLSFLYCIVNENPRSILEVRGDLPKTVAKVVEKALEKEVALRYQAATEIVSDLASLTQKKTTVQAVTVSPAKRKLPSIAVLPFRDMSPQQDQGYLSEGLAEAVTTTLTRIEGLRVVSRNSVLQLWEKGSDLSEIGRKLGCERALQGSIRKAANRLRVSTQLVETADGSLQWAEDFEHNMSEVFELEDEISRKTVEALKVNLGGVHETQIYKSYTDDSEAYTAYLKGRFHWNQRTVESLKQSIGYFTEAIDLDAGFASAYSGLADAHIILGMYGAYSPAEVMPRAKDSATRALEIDERLAEAHVSLGCIEAVYDWRWGAAESQFLRGIELNSNYATAHHWYCVNHLIPLGRFEEARNEIREALRLDPVSLAINATLGLTHYFAGEYDQAIKEFERALAMDANFPIANFFLGQALSQKSQPEEALPFFRRAIELYGQSPNMMASYANSAARAGNQTAAEETLDDLLRLSEERYVSSYDLALVLLGLGRDQEALARLDQAFSERSYLLVYLNVEPMLERLRTVPQFQNLSRRIFGRFSGGV